MENKADYRVIFLRRSIDQIENAQKWYNEKQPGLGTVFTNNILRSIEELRSDTITYKPVYRGLCRIVMKQFPYTVYFKKDGVQQCILIFGVLHHKQKRQNLNKSV